MMNQTIGQWLRSAREELGISIEEAAHETHIRVNYLQELEADHPELLHSAAQARGFLRLYADFLSLSYEELLAIWENKQKEQEPEESRTVQSRKKFKPKWFRKDSTKAAEKVEEPGSEDAETEGRLEKPSQEVEESAKPELRDPETDTPAIEQTIADQQQPSGKDVSDVKTQSPSRLPHFLTRISKQFARFNPLKNKGKQQESDSALEADQSPSAPPQTSADVFKEIGQLMHSRRKMMELNLSDIENFTNLKRTFLVSIEEGRFNELPSTVQGRGMLNNYAKFLGMEESAVMDLYGFALQLLREERQRPRRQVVNPPVSVKLNLPEKWRKILNPDLIIGGALIVGLFAFIIWGATQVFNAAASSPTEAPSISEVLQITATVISTYMEDTPEPGEDATVIPGVAVVESTPTNVATVNAAPLQLYIITHDRAYMSVVVDGIEAFSGRVSLGNVYTYSGNESINLLTGNASALEVYFNQEYLGNLGSVGEVVDIDFTLAGLSTPTPQATRTPTIEVEIDEEIDAMEPLE